MKELNKILNIISITLITLSILAGFIIWVGLPGKIPVHFSPFSPDRYGSKMEILFVFIIPLFGLIKPQVKEYPYIDDEIKIKIKQEKRKISFFQLFTSVLCCGSFWMLIILTMKNL